MRVGATQAFPVRVPAEAARASQATETAEAARWSAQAGESAAYTGVPHATAETRGSNFYSPTRPGAAGADPRAVPWAAARFRCARPVPTRCWCARPDTRPDTRSDTRPIPRPTGTVSARTAARSISAGRRAEPGATDAGGLVLVHSPVQFLSSDVGSERVRVLLRRGVHSMEPEPTGPAAGFLGVLQRLQSGLRPATGMTRRVRVDTSRLLFYDDYVLYLYGTVRKEG